MASSSAAGGSSMSGGRRRWSKKASCCAGCSCQMERCSSEVRQYTCAAGASPKKPRPVTGSPTLCTPVTAASSSVAVQSSEQRRPSTDADSNVVADPGWKRTCVTSSVCTSNRLRGRCARRKSHTSTAVCVPTARRCPADTSTLHTSSCPISRVAAQPSALGSHAHTVPSDAAEYSTSDVVDEAALAKASSLMRPEWRPASRTHASVCLS
mmetsp:Transcript_31902/g.74348  ORF Transcript_31902/g.74348 Transcript_31902/m.74348 type:complete len:210 (+) Transcript_31902:617-1246(+)